MSEVYDEICEGSIKRIVRAQRAIQRAMDYQDPSVERELERAFECCKIAKLQVEANWRAHQRIDLEVKP